MNYKKIYDSLINNANNRLLEGYSETHHIIPRCMGGTDDSSNLVVLTPEEHYLAHQLLIKIYPANKSLLYAAQMMTVENVDSGVSRPNNKLYGWIKTKISKEKSERMTGSTLPEEHRANISKGQTGIKRGPMTEEHKRKISEALSGKPKGEMSDESRKKMSESAKNRTHSEETKKKIGDAHRGKKLSEETKAKMRKPMSEETKAKIAAARRGKKYPRK